jgi:hypothetical protein
MALAVLEFKQQAIDFCSTWILYAPIPRLPPILPSHSANISDLHTSHFTAIQHLVDFSPVQSAELARVKTRFPITLPCFEAMARPGHMPRSATTCISH